MRKVDEIGTMLKKQRMVHSVSAEEMAEKLNVCTNTIRRYEKGEGIENFQTIESLSKEYKIPLMKLLFTPEEIRNGANQTEIEQVNLTIQQMPSDAREIICTFIKEIAGCLERNK
ncbi:helix-turn-helix domain-containing protein [Roseburia sp. 499]|uniref:helix-turn-helix domain-containing protein n=1 Tax=Roseburia sp. 499 TaxID=1261634 RepID=UPI000952736A|nr:helix-turn-helix transcriptional regulator [Roseburia sp. 499]WVK69385.1 helix-turn-helix transcriptional regulator [Roseburia sp. 499]